MGCDVIKTERGAMIVCGRNRGKKKQLCQFPGCGQYADFECDFPVSCSKAFCLKHGRRVASNTDYCWEHLAA